MIAIYRISFEEMIRTIAINLLELFSIVYLYENHDNVSFIHIIEVEPKVHAEDCHRIVDQGEQQIVIGFIYFISYHWSILVVH